MPTSQVVRWLESCGIGKEPCHFLAFEGGLIMGVDIVDYACMTPEFSTTTAWDSQDPQKARALRASLLSYHAHPRPQSFSG